MKRVKSVVGATGRALLFRAKQVDGTVYDLTDLTVTLKAGKDSDDAKIDDQECTVTDESNGLFEYTPLAAECNEAGVFNARVKLDNGSTIDFLEKMEIEFEEEI